MEKKQIITVDVEEIAPYEFATSLGYIKSKIEDLIKQYGEEAILNWQPDFYYPYDPNPSPRFQVQIRREENDEEFEKRVAKEQEWKTAQKKRDLAEFERLQKIFKK